LWFNVQIGQLIIAVCIGTLYAMSFTLVDLQFGVLLGLVLGLLDIVPFLGYGSGRHHRHGARGSPDGILCSNLDRDQGRPDMYSE
tara:strand:+ start:293 stop:547 length:255 start_codon:yes stop_codon:yes gene_type:complete